MQAFLERPIEGDWPYIWIDATYLKVRRGGGRSGGKIASSHRLVEPVAIRPVARIVRDASGARDILEVDREI